MRILVDEQGNTVAYLYKRAIVDKNLSKVLGIVLGNCLFAKSQTPVGRLFKDTLRDENGHIIAKVQDGHHVEHSLNINSIRNSVWDIMMRIEHYVTNWLPEKSIWSQEGFESFLHRKSSPVLVI